MTPGTWQKSSYSGSGDGNNCVEIADLHTRVAVRDTKDRSRTPLSFPTDVFTTFITNLKASTR
ncbi:DUF397 domain-containing protein [Streptomyces sp. P17]|uniref:DUF397 domain-containing protein n=1 Tax=Streptomyces sp. P17 TaxID=3074716 RepID=UPI0028F3E393|nr:DUF397 domain-containing protein [Streptomyces sp. P17]MDT9700840.1 DUF397 domain-containing protein [Streptomyces sp. P17]